MGHYTLRWNEFYVSLCIRSMDRSASMLFGENWLEIETSRTLSDSGGPKTSPWSVGSSCIEGCSYKQYLSVSIVWRKLQGRETYRWMQYHTVFHLKLDMGSKVDDQRLRYQRTQNRPAQTSIGLQNTRHTSRTYLGSSITRQGIIPKSLMRTSNRNLILMIPMSKCTSSKNRSSKEVR